MNITPIRLRNLSRRMACITLGAFLFFAGMLVGGFGRNETYDITGIDAGFRKSEVDAMFSKYLSKKIAYHIKLHPIGACSFDVAIVDESRGADSGFVALDSPVTQFFVLGDGYKIYRYDKDHLFVILSDWYVNQLKRSPERP
jgi:hypothetical protein